MPERAVLWSAGAKCVTFFRLTLQKRKATRKEIFKRAEKYVKEYKQREKDEIRLRRQAKMTGGLYVPAENKLAFVVRIRGCV